jgi:branched-chain amino acid transport system substrate-binding protein
MFCGCRRSEHGLRIVTLTDLTGPQAVVGQGIRLAAELALAENQTPLRNAGWRVELTAYDAYGFAQDLPASVSRLASQADAFCAVVHTGSEGNASASQILHAAGIPAVYPLETAPLPDGEEPMDTVWLSADDSTHGAAAAEWAAANARTIILLLLDSNPHAQAVGEGFLRRAEDLGLSVSGVQLSAVQDPSEWIPSFYSTPPQLVFFSGSSDLAGSILAVLEDLSFHGSFFFAECEGENRLPKTFFSDTIPLFFSPAAEQSEDFMRIDGFADRFREAFGADPPDLSALGYDAAVVCLQTLLEIDASDTGPTSPRERTISIWQAGKTFQGITGGYSARGRPCRTALFTRFGNSESPWTPVLPAGTINGSNPDCGQTSEKAG